MIVKSESETYPIIYAESMNLTSSEVLEDWIRNHPKCRKIVIVTDTRVYKMQNEELNRFKRLLVDEDSLNVSIKMISEGENSKSISEAELLWTHLAEIGFCRNDLLVAFGGGMIGDLVGFCASTYMRGVSYIQIPTTLLAQIDSSVGGKVAINLNQGKNLIGQFYNPEMVIIDIRYLLTLDEAIFIDGLGELIKYGLLGANILLNWLSNYQNVTAIKRVIIESPLEFESIIKQCLEIKRVIVEADFKENGIRKYLNYGHTIGHAIEQNFEYRLRHGNCVIQGCWWLFQLAIENESQNILLHIGDKYEQVNDTYAQDSNQECKTNKNLIQEMKSDDVKLGDVNTSPKLECLKVQLNILEKLMKQYGFNIEKSISVKALISFLKIDKKNTREGIQFIWPNGECINSGLIFLSDDYRLDDLYIIRDEAVLKMLDANVTIKVIPIELIVQMMNKVLSSEKND